MLLTARWDGGKDWKGGRRGGSLYGGQENFSVSEEPEGWSLGAGFSVWWGGETLPEDVAGAGLTALHSGGAPHVAKTGLSTSASSAVHLSSKGAQGIKSAIITPSMLKEPWPRIIMPSPFRNLRLLYLRKKSK